MDYSEFVSYIRQNIQKFLDSKEVSSVSVITVNKNNGVCLDGLCIKGSEDKMSPTIYLNTFYQRFINGESLDDLLKEIAHEYNVHIPSFHFHEEEFEDISTIKNSIFYRIVNYDRNKELLQDVPFKKVNDLAITYRWLAHKDNVGIATALIKNKELEYWGISNQELHFIAMENTPRMFPANITSVKNILTQYLTEEETEQICPLYVLSNADGINGASCMLYPHILQNFARKIETNFYILPSSIHEVILLPESTDTTVNNLYDMVQEANQTVVQNSDILSDNVYYFDHKTNHIVIA